MFKQMCLFPTHFEFKSHCLVTSKVTFIVKNSHWFDEN